MAYNGYLLKIGNYTFPNAIIERETFDSTYNTQDLDSKRGANGIMHRTALSHRVLTVDFDTIDGLTNDVIGNVMSEIQSNYTNNDEKRASVTAFVPELNRYITQDCYLNPSMKFPIKEIDNEDNKVYYNTISFSFTGY